MRVKAVRLEVGKDTILKLVHLEFVKVRARRTQLLLLQNSVSGRYVSRERERERSKSYARFKSEDEVQNVGK